MRSISATEGPPNFMTRRAMTHVRGCKCAGRHGFCGVGAERRLYIPAGADGCNLTLDGAGVARGIQFLTNFFRSPLAVKPPNTPPSLSAATPSGISDFGSGE